MIRVPVLCYHAVSETPSAWIADLSVTSRQFASHLETISALGRVPIGPGVLAEALATGGAVPAGSVVITFDDGFADVATVAAPLLTHAGFPAGIYVTTGVVGGQSPGGDQMLTWRQIQELAACGFEIGGHTHRHHQLDAVSAAVALNDVVECRDRLQDRLGYPVAGFAYPHGYSSRGVRRMVQEAGFTHAYAVRNMVTTEADDRYAISRLTVRADTGSAQLAAWLSGQDLPLRPWPRPLLVAGWRAYRRVAARRGRSPAWGVRTPEIRAGNPAENPVDIPAGDPGDTAQPIRAN